MKQPLMFEESKPLDEVQSGILINLMMVEKKGLTDEILKGVEDSFLYKIYQKRMEVLKLPLKLSPTALFFLICLCDRVGHVPVFMIDCLELQRDLHKDNLTLDDVVKGLYPWGFYTEEAFINRIDNEIKPGKGEFDSIY